MSIIIVIVKNYYTERQSEQNAWRIAKMHVPANNNASELFSMRQFEKLNVIHNYYFTRGKINYCRTNNKFIISLWNV
jgi:hypothetical protein